MNEQIQMEDLSAWYLNFYNKPFLQIRKLRLCDLLKVPGELSDKISPWAWLNPVALSSLFFHIPYFI
jgi:hypothetical protein